MLEKGRQMQSEVRQAKSMLKYFFLDSRNLQERPGHGTRGALAILEAYSPGIIKESGIEKHPGRIVATKSLTNYLIGLNDLIDFSGANRPDIQDKVEEVKVREQERKQRLDVAIDQLPETERGRAKNIISSNVRELLFVEGDIRIARDERHSVRFDEVDRYRSLVNAMDLSSIIGILLGPGYLDNRFVDFSNEQLSMEKIEDKYRWITDSIHLTEVERPVAAIYNMCQAAQVIDDIQGYDLDIKLRVPTYATVALEQQRTWARAKDILKLRQKEYEKNAESLGLNRGTIKGFLEVIKVGSKAFYVASNVGRILPEQSRPHRWLRRRLAPRENANLQKRL